MSVKRTPETLWQKPKEEAPMTPTELIKALEAQGCRVDRDFIEWPDGTWLRASGGVIEKAASLFAAQDRRIEAMRRALELARQEIVVAIAFLGRDEGTDRLTTTVPGLIQRLVKADAEVRAALKEPTDAE